MTLLILGASGKVGSSENYKILHQYALEHDEELFLSSRQNRNAGQLKFSWLCFNPAEPGWKIPFNKSLRLIFLLGQYSPQTENYWQKVFQNSIAEIEQIKHVTVVTALSAFVADGLNGNKSDLYYLFKEKGIKTTALCCSGFFSDYQYMYSRSLLNGKLTQYQGRGSIVPISERDVLKASLKVSRLELSGKYFYFGKEELSNDEIYEKLKSYNPSLKRELIPMENASKRVHKSEKAKKLDEFQSAHQKIKELGIEPRDSFLSFLDESFGKS